MNRYFKHVTAMALVAASVTTACAQLKTTDTLYNNFIDPPQSAKPRVWWHWMNGNVTKDGIYKDLNWMKRAGIAGFQHFDAAMTTPQRVKERLVFMTPAWKDAFQYTTRLADSLKLEMAIAGSPGWSQSGGPWVPPKDGMKKIGWSETSVQGGKTINIVLPKPPGITGPFQNIPYVRIEGLENPTNQPTPQYAQDVAVIAYKLADTDIPMHVLKPILTSSGGNITLAQLTDGDVANTTLLPADTKGQAWLQFAFKNPCTIKAMTIACRGNNDRVFEKSDDGVNFRFVCKVPGSGTQQTINIPAATAKYFRFTFNNSPGGIPVAEIVLHTAARVNKFEEKAAFSLNTRVYEKSSPETSDAIYTTDVIDITNKVTADGNLTWAAPAGNWNIIRFGYSLLGKTNHPATSEGTGLEVDKLDSAAISSYFRNYLDKYKSATGGLMGNKGGLQFLITDSWEAGPQNWTANMMQQFQKRRGYSMTPWMPVITGRIVKSAEASENFLWDVRTTLAEMLVEYHYDQLSAILKEYGLKRYSESHEFMRALLADGMDVKRKADIPMSALWIP
ncbi:MAG: glycoside hydrolase, partial [Sphingobacteriaceae bacterium]